MASRRLLKQTDGFIRQCGQTTSTGLRTIDLVPYSDTNYFVSVTAIRGSLPSSSEGCNAFSIISASQVSVVGGSSNYKVAWLTEGY